MRYTILLLFVLCSTHMAVAQGGAFYINRCGKVMQSSEDPDYVFAKSNPYLMPYKDGNRYGFVNRQGKKVTAAIYMDAKPSEGLYAKAYGEGLIGTYVDTNGKELYPVKPDTELELFPDPSGPFLKITTAGKQGLIRPDGSYIMPLRNEPIEIYTTTVPGVYKIEVDDRKSLYQLFSLEKGLYGEKFETLAPPNEGMRAIRCKSGGDWGFTDEDGKLVLPCKYKSLNYTYFIGGQAQVQEDKVWKSIDKTGNQVPPRYKKIQDLQPGYKRYMFEGKWGYLDPAGNYITEPIYEYLERFVEGYAVVKQAGLYGIIDSAGKLVVPAQHRMTAVYPGGYGAITRADGQITYINRKGEVVPKEEYDKMRENRGDIIVYEQNGKKGYKHHGKVIIPAQFDDAKWFSEGLAAVKLGEKWGYINEAGEEVIGFYLGMANSFNEKGVARVAYGNGQITIEDVKQQAQAEIDKEKAVERRKFARTQVPVDPNACLACSGSGYEESGSASCRTCNGAGSKACNSCRGGYTYNSKGESSYCSMCRGAGTISCYSCFGSGKVAAAEKRCSTCKGSGKKG